MSVPPPAPVYVDPGYRAGGFNHVVISKIDIPFWSLVGLLIKIAIASIPAAIVMMIIFSVFFGCMWATLAAIGLSFTSLISTLNR